MKRKTYLLVRPQYVSEPKFYLIIPGTEKEEGILLQSNNVFNIDYKTPYDVNNPKEQAAVTLSIALQYDEFKKYEDMDYTAGVPLSEIPDWSNTEIKTPIYERPDVIVCSGSL
ncbi:MAG: hypothetical protein HQK95_09410 [Nitrospirae bacterium]|nr:hypothetical protein [Nitrospirota bacterium]